jgi:putative tricarboxylic transport membrane protein
MLEAFLGGLDRVLTPEVLLALLGGTVFGWIIGVLPGLGSLNALAIALPISFFWSPVMAMYFFAGIIGAASQGGAITAILLNMPGEAQNAATMFDGHPLARKGKAAWVLGISAGASVYGAFFGILVLLALIPIFLPILLAFGPAEKFWVMVFGLVALSLSIQGDFWKGLVAVCVGILLTFIGIGGPALLVERFTFGSTFLQDGLHLVAVVVGLLVVGESVGYLAMSVSVRGSGGTTLATDAASQRSFGAEFTDALRGLLVPFRYPATFFRGAVIGTAIGAIPGVGGTVAQFLAYNSAMSASKDPSSFGKGNPEGVVAAESSVNAKEGGSLLPTFLFGIPGNAEMALVLAAWQIHGVQAGPFFLERHADLAWALILGLFVANTIASLMTICTVGLSSWVPRLDVGYMAPAVLVLVAISLVALRGSVLDLGVGLLAGLLGFGMQRFGYPAIGTVIGFVLGGSIEQNYYTALQSARGSYAVFVGSPVAVVLILATILVPTVVLVLKLRKRQAGRQAARLAAASPLPGGKP